MNELMRQGELLERLENGALTISLIGMSNMGKSAKSQRLVEEAKFERICIDDRIEAELNPILESTGCGVGTTGMAEWLGQPYDPQYHANQKTYLDLETWTMRNVLRDLRKKPPRENTVIDTTGSFVHTGEEIMDGLRALSLVVYIKETKKVREKMFDEYLTKRKPVIFGDNFSQHEGESLDEALARSYNVLLDERSQIYAEAAHVIIPKKRSLKGIGAIGFLGKIIAELPE